MNTILRISRYFVVLSVIGCLVMFGAVKIFAALASGNAIADIARRGLSLDEIATVIVYVTCSPRCGREILLVLPAWRGGIDAEESV